MQDEVEMRTEELARWTVERSKSLGADCASAEVSHDKGLSVTVRMGEVDAVEHTEERVLMLNAWIGGRKGCASTADFSERSLEAAVQAAVDIARVSAEDPAADDRRAGRNTAADTKSGTGYGIQPGWSEL